LSYSLQKLLLFEIPCSILSFGLPTLREGPSFDIQIAKQAQAARLRGEGIKPGEWKKMGKGFNYAHKTTK
jgi:hypothetical protein